MTEIRMPDFHAPFPLERNPHMQEASKIMWEWIDLRGLAATPKARARMLNTGADLSGAYVWPRAGLSMLSLGLKWLALTFRIDDQLDEDDSDEQPGSRARCIEELCGILHDVPAPQSPVADALHELWKETRTGRPASWQRAFVADFEAFLRSYALEAKLKAAGRIPELTEYLGWRMYSVGMPWLWDLDELRLPLYLPDSVRNCQTMSTLRQAGSLHIALVNDVFSVERESITGYPYNAVSLTMQAQSCSLQEAVDQVADQVTEHAQVVSRILEHLPTELGHQQLPPDVRTAALDYSENIALNLRGQLAWHASVRRYATADITEQWTGNYPGDLLRQAG
ncbi:sesquiterpene cyclase [Kitasatospora sp. NBC_00085]|uniref:terpene synthase family protein n=1 Tax=unclassified Kitasatospora TaxID=2633591 RepID=UPI00325479FD